MKVPALLVPAVSAIAMQAQTLTLLASFHGTNRRSPNSLVQGTDGNLYVADDNGNIFKLTQSKMPPVSSGDPDSAIACRRRLPAVATIDGTHSPSNTLITVQQ